MPKTPSRTAGVYWWLERPSEIQDLLVTVTSTSGDFSDPVGRCGRCETADLM